MGLLSRKLRSRADQSSLSKRSVVWAAWATARGADEHLVQPNCAPTEELSAAIGWADRVVSIHAAVGGHGYLVLSLLS